MSNCEHMFLRVEGFSSNLYIQKSIPINFQKLKPKSKWGQDCLTAMTFHPSSADNNCCPRQHKLMHQCTKQHDSQQQKNKSENRIKLFIKIDRETCFITSPDDRFFIGFCLCALAHRKKNTERIE